MKLETLIIVGGLIAVVAFFMGAFDGDDTPEASILSQQQNGNTIIPTDSGVVVTFLGVDKYDSSVSILGNHEYRTRPNSGVEWSPWTTVADGGTATLGATTEYEIAWGVSNNSAAADETYFIKETSGKLQGVAQTVSLKDGIRNGSLTVRLFNEEGDLITGNTNETLAANEEVTLSGDVELQNERGAPYGLVVVLEFAQTGYDFADVEMSIDGKKKTTAVPSFYTRSAAGNDAKAFDVDPILDNGKHDWQLVLNTDTNNPGVSDDVTVTFYPKDKFKNSETDEYEIGVEDQDGTQVALAPTVFTVNVD